jgi:hypothetical protein
MANNIKSFNEHSKNEKLDLSDVSESIDKSKLFKTSDFTEWLEKTAPEYINIKDLEMYVSQYSH